jgi:phosphoribosylformylglycinamidine cyclo-ligase
MADSNKPSSSHDSDAYAQAGVSLEAAEDTVHRLGALVEGTRTPGVLAGIGGFGSLFSLKDAGVVSGADSDPILVSGTDGVGTKLQLAFELDRHDTIGIDCVAMCVNDVITSGARPLFFLDYFATGKLRPEQAEAVVRGIAEGCKESGCALVGGETAEMPGFYRPGEYDLAGFCVGVVERGDMLSPARVKSGNAIIGVASSGLHSNGFSLVRKIIADNDLALDAVIDELADDKTLGDVLLEPTRLYVGLVRELLDGMPVHGLAHITGGGFFENLPRALPDGLGATIDAAAWQRAPIFEFLQAQGEVPAEQMYRVFNMGIGMAIIVDRQYAADAVSCAEAQGFDAWEIGEVIKGEGVDLSL